MKEITPLYLCKGLTRTVYNRVTELIGEDIVETRDYDHPISYYEKRAEETALNFLLKESKIHGNIKIAFGFELNPEWYCIHNGDVRDKGDLETVKRFTPHICILSDPIDGSKADVPVYESQFGKSVQDGDIDKVFSTAIAFFPDKASLKNSVACALQRWDGRQYYGDKHEAYIENKGEPVYGVKAKVMDDIGLKTKIYPAAHYAHAVPVSYFIITYLNKKLGLKEKVSFGVRSTGSTTCDIVEPTITNSIAIDIRAEVGKELEKHGIKIKRGCYTHDFAPPGFFAKKAGCVVLNLNGNDLDCNLFEYKTGSYFVAPPGKAGETVFRILKEEILPQIPERVDKWLKDEDVWKDVNWDL